jgi:hypothetical protein
MVHSGLLRSADNRSECLKTCRTAARDSHRGGQALDEDL